MLGALIKTYYAKKENIDPEKIFVVSVMPCIAKKYEMPREALRNANGLTGDALPQGKRTVVIPCGESVAGGE